MRRRARVVASAATIVLGLASCTAGGSTGPSAASGTAAADGPGPREAIAVWPEDTAPDLLAQAERVRQGADAWRLDPAETALAFADLVLAWPDAQVAEPEVHRYATRVLVQRRRDGPAVVVTLAQVVEPIWSVIAVADADAPRAAPFSIRAGRVQVQVGLPRGTTALVTVGYGQRVATRALASPGTLRFDLGSTPTTGGHVLILYVDGRNRAVSAFGTPIPAGDTAAG